MINIIRSDLFRLGKAKIWIICLIIFPIIMITPGLYSMDFLSTVSGDPNLELAGEHITAYCDANNIEPYELSTEKQRELVLELDWFKPDLVTIGGNYFYVFIIVLMLEMLIVTRDFSCHSIKNTLSTPVTRKTYFVSKTLTVAGLSTCSLIALNLYTWIVNLILNGSGHALSLGMLLWDTIKQIPALLMFISMFNLLAFIIRKSLPFILTAAGIFFFLSTILINIMLVIGLVPYFLLYTPSNLFGDVLYISDPEYHETVYHMIIACGTVIPLANIGGYLLFRKQEIK